MEILCSTKVLMEPNLYLQIFISELWKSCIACYLTTLYELSCSQHDCKCTLHRMLLQKLHKTKFHLKTEHLSSWVWPLFLWITTSRHSVWVDIQPLILTWHQSVSICNSTPLQFSGSDLRCWFIHVTQHVHMQEPVSYVLLSGFLGIQWPRHQKSRSESAIAVVHSSLLVHLSVLSAQ